MSSCIENNAAVVVDICSELQPELLYTMQQLNKNGVCPTCALYAIAMMVAQSFKEKTDCENEDIMKAAIAGVAKACDAHVSIEEGSVH